MNYFSKIFNSIKCAAIGMIHVQALPGTPRSVYSMQQIIDFACKEAMLYRKCGVVHLERKWSVKIRKACYSNYSKNSRPLHFTTSEKKDGLIVENMFDIPYVCGDEMGPEITACMTRICAEVKKAMGEIPCGIQILSSNNTAATAVALAAGLQFVRVENFVFSHVADEGLINACAGSLLRYSRNIGAKDIIYLTDIKKKHCSHTITSDITVSQMAKAAEFFLSDGVILTGMETGDPPKASDLNDVQKATKLPVIIGSGVTINNINDFVTADGVIVGSHFKHNGHWSGHVDGKRVSTFMEAIQKCR